MRKLFIDTCIFIEFARTGKGTYLEILEQAIAEKSMLITSSLVVFEFWQGRSLNNPRVLLQAETLFSKEIAVYPVTTSISKLAGELVRTNQCQQVDALLAATAIEQDAYLVTLNKKDFRSVKKLRILD